jgi:cytochrome c-type biogenesis protein CcmH/NrfG
MGRNDWFQSTSWTDAERERFEQKLSRARRSNRPGYLRVQGTILTESDDPGLREAGRELLRRAIRDDESDWPIEAQWARMNLGKALAREGMLDEAERCYRECARTQEEHGGYGVNTDCHLGLAEVLLRGSPGDRKAADEAAAALDKASELNPPLFQSEIWRFSSALARVAAARGDRERARHWAKEALDVAALDKPLAPRHPGVGLARPAPEDRDEMERLAS